MADNPNKLVVDSIITQFHGGEHKLAGARASELVYGKRKTPDEKLMAELEERAKGIQRYISAPETPVTLVDDQGGNPLATQPENRDDAMYPSNMSSEEAKDEQNDIDDRLKAGRERRAKSDNADDIGSTRLNPEGSDKDNVKDKRQPKKVSGPGR